MRYFLFMVIYLSTLCSHAQPVPVKVKPLYNYDFVGQNIDLKTGVNYFVITNRKQFNKFFGTTSRPDTPSFDKEWMLVMLLPETKQDAKLSFDKVDMKAGNFIEVYCTAKLNLGRLPYTTYPIAVCTVPRYAGVSKVNFYNNHMRLMQSVEAK